LLIFVFLVIAFRETGGDFEYYQKLVNLVSIVSFDDAMKMSEPAFGALNWISNWLGFGIYGVNAVCALIFLFGFARFCARESRPFLMLALSIPYLIIVVVVGYTRQGTAIGFELVGLVALMRRKLLMYVLWIAAAATFHRSAAFLLPLAYFAVPLRSRVLGRMLAGPGILAGIFFIYNDAGLNDTASTYIANYVESDHYNSAGALVRSFMSASAALVFLFNWRRWGRTWTDRDIWLVFSIAALALVPLTQVASTAADRTGLYIIPLQIIVFARLPVLWRSQSRLIVVGALAVYALAFVVYFYFGKFSSDLWLPYRSPLLGEFA
jgi:hypothetical protein